MRKTFSIIAVMSFFVIISTVTCLCQDYDESGNGLGNEKDLVKGNVEDVAKEDGIKLPPGMELRKIGGINMVVPKGSKLYKDGPVFRMEEDGGYMARRLKAVDERINRLEERQKKAEDDILELRKLVNKDQKQ